MQVTSPGRNDSAVLLPRFLMSVISSKRIWGCFRIWSTFSTVSSVFTSYSFRTDTIFLQSSQKPTVSSAGTYLCPSAKNTESTVFLTRTVSGVQKAIFTIRRAIAHVSPAAVTKQCSVLHQNQLRAGRTSGKRTVRVLNNRKSPESFFNSGLNGDKKATRYFHT